MSSNASAAPGSVSASHKPFCKLKSASVVVMGFTEGQRAMLIAGLCRLSSSAIFHSIVRFLQNQDSEVKCYFRNVVEGSLLPSSLFRGDALI
jgi:hypothetical protein